MIKIDRQSTVFSIKKAVVAEYLIIYDFYPADCPMFMLTLKIEFIRGFVELHQFGAFDPFIGYLLHEYRNSVRIEITNPSLYMTSA